MKQTERIELRISAKEKATLQQRSLNEGLSLSEYIKRRAMEDRPRAEQAPKGDATGVRPAPLDAEPPPVAPKPVEKPRDPQPESDYRRIRRAGLKQRKL